MNGMEPVFTPIAASSPTPALPLARCAYWGGRAILRLPSVRQDAPYRWDSAVNAIPARVR